MTVGTGSRDQAVLVRALLEARERGDSALAEEAARQLPRGSASVRTRAAARLAARRVRLGRRPAQPVPASGGARQGAYRQRLRDLDAELAEARSWADAGQVARLGLEREALLGELSAAAGLGARPRRFSSADERARVAVRKAIAAALTRIEDRDPARPAAQGHDSSRRTLPLRSRPHPPGLLAPVKALSVLRVPPPMGG